MSAAPATQRGSMKRLIAPLTALLLAPAACLPRDVTVPLGSDHADGAIAGAPDAAQGHPDATLALDGSQGHPDAVGVFDAGQEDREAPDVATMDVAGPDVPPPQGIDLSIAWVVRAQSTSPGSLVVLDVAVQNAGDQAVGAVGLQVLLCGVPCQPPAGVLLLDVQLGMVPPGATRTFTVTPTLPMSLPLGAYELHLVLDPNNVVAELDEGNNRAVLDLDLVDLQIRPEILDLGMVQLGNRVEGQLAVTNTGSTPATLFTVGFSGGSSAALSVLVSLPLQLPPGGSVTIPVLFGPIDLGAVTGDLLFQHDRSALPSMVRVSGSGT